MSLDNLTPDLLKFMALSYTPEMINSLCRSNKKFNNIICKSGDFWMNKVSHDYGEHGHRPKRIIKTYKTIYNQSVVWNIINC